QKKLWKRYNDGELRLYTKSVKRVPPTPDYRGRPRVWNQEHYLLNDAYSARDPRHTVLEAHCFRLADGRVGASGLIDPKNIVIGDINYRQLEYANPRCE